MAFSFSAFLIGKNRILLAGTESGQAKIGPSTPVLDLIGAVSGKNWLGMIWTTYLYNKSSRIRTRALGALTGVSSAPLTAILRIIESHLKPYHKAAQQIHINSKKNL